MVIMAVDFGDVRTGVAVCDKMEMLAVPLTVIKENYVPKLADKLCELIEAHSPELLVVGLPKNMDGSLGYRAQCCTQFAELLEEKSGIKTVMWDERLTSVIAHNNMRMSGKKEKQHKARIDAAAATEILQSYLDSRKSR